MESKVASNPSEHHDAIASLCFDILFTKSFPHILEKIFLSLDYGSYKTCMEVSKAWNELLMSKTFQTKSKTVFHKEILEDEKKLHKACGEGDISKVRGLLSIQMLDVNSMVMTQEDFGWSQSSLRCTLTLTCTSTPLCEAAEGGHLEVATLLLDNGAEPDKAPDSGGDPQAWGGPCRGWNPLHGAAKHGHTSIVQLLLERGADINKVDKKYATPLSKAARFNHKDVVKVLLDGGAEPDKADKSGYTPLQLAARNGDEDVIKLLVDGGADINKANRNGSTPLHLAVAAGSLSNQSRDVSCMETLLDLGADPDETDVKGKSPLHIAVSHGNKFYVKLLLDRGANPNKADNKGQTPLSIAQQNNQKNNIKLLTDAG